MNTAYDLSPSVISTPSNVLVCKTVNYIVKHIGTGSMRISMWRHRNVYNLPYRWNHQTLPLLSTVPPTSMCHWRRSPPCHLSPGSLAAAQRSHWHWCISESWYCLWLECQYLPEREPQGSHFGRSHLGCKMWDPCQMRNIHLFQSVVKCRQQIVLHETMKKVIIHRNADSNSKIECGLT